MHMVQIERRIQMREKRAAARNLIDQFIAKLSGIYGRQDEIILTVEMLGGRLWQLARRREVDVAVLQINGRAAKNALRQCSVPLLPGQYLEYEVLIHERRVVFFVARENPSVAFLTEYYTIANVVLEA
jgi:hypothetical protein